MISLRDVRKVYGDVVALDGVDLAVDQGVIHGIVGPSGAGKSTLVRCLTGLERPTSGAVELGGHDLATMGEGTLRQARRRIGMVFQHVHLLEARTAAANIAYPLAVTGTPRPQRRERVDELLELVGLTGRGSAYPAQLSGGQKQRVGIARALASHPDVLLCDEPTSALDSETTGQILDLIHDIRDRTGVTVVIITHEMDVVRRVCDSVSLLDAGRIVESGAVADVVREPGTRLSKALVPLPALRVGEHAVLDVFFSASRPAPQDGIRLDKAGGDDSGGAEAFAIARDHGAVVEAGTFETLGEASVGRIAMSVPPERRAALTEALHSSGFHVEVRP